MRSAGNMFPTMQRVGSASHGTCSALVLPRSQIATTTTSNQRNDAALPPPPKAVHPAQPGSCSCFNRSTAIKRHAPDIIPELDPNQGRTCTNPAAGAVISAEPEVDVFFQVSIWIGSPLSVFPKHKGDHFRILACFPKKTVPFPTPPGHTRRVAFTINGPDGINRFNR
ncbi:hypothetical protein APED_01700 [Acanthopleuribacter pedis]